MRMPTTLASLRVLSFLRPVRPARTLAKRGGRGFGEGHHRKTTGLPSGAPEWHSGLSELPRLDEIDEHGPLVLLQDGEGSRSSPIRPLVARDLHLWECRLTAPENN